MALYSSTGEIPLKFLIIGDSGVGKTSVLTRFTEASFDGDYCSTIGVDFKSTSMMVENGERSVKLQIWDSAGQERFQSITSSYYRNAMGIIIVYDILKRSSFDNIPKRWKPAVDYTADPRKVSMVLVGNKYDQQTPSTHKKLKRQVTVEEGQALAEEYGIPFIETSAKTGHNVKEAFTLLVEEVERKKKEQAEERNDILQQSSAFRLDSLTSSSSSSSSSWCTGGCRKG